MAVALLVASAVVNAGPTGEPEPELRALLKAAIAQSDSFQDRFDAEVWLVDMSSRLRRYIKDDKERLDFLRLLHQEADRANITPELALAVVQIESGFNRYALSTAGAQGYMQIMPFWLREIAGPEENLLHTRTNLRMGCTILRYYLDRERGDLVKALQRYNGSYGKPQYPALVINALNKRWYRG
ncbi:lytic transglycosylase domain-containing protein [Hydrocarboniphaga sp.]|uniref:lytic transglycosylase domain-containing protein n=1 Tax=Hydrocarboniphaga sp. TaxID=2033016 RepID=UPI0034522316